MSGANVNIGQITVNVNDTIPPDNYATVDAGTKVGTVYTKEQNNAWRKEVEQNTNAGIKGVAKPDDTIVTTGFYRMLANTAETYTNYLDENDAPIVVTADDLNVVNGVQRNEVIIEVNNGVSIKKVFAKVGADGANGTATIPQWMPDDYSPNAMVVDNFIQYIAPNGATATDVPGESSAWKVIGSKIELENEIIPTDQTKAVSGKAVADYVGDFRYKIKLGEEKKTDLTSLLWKSGFYINNSGVETVGASAEYLEINVLKGDTLSGNLNAFFGAGSILLIGESGIDVKYDFSNNQNLIYNYLVKEDGRLIINRNNFSPDPIFLDLYHLESVEIASVIDYVDNSLMLERKTTQTETIDLAQGFPNAYFDLNNGVVGTTKFDTLTTNLDYNTSRLVQVNKGDEIIVTLGTYGWSGVALFDENGILSNKLLWNYDGVRSAKDAKIIIPEDGFVQMAYEKTKTNSLKKNVRVRDLSIQEFYDQTSSQITSITSENFISLNKPNGVWKLNVTGDLPVSSTDKKSMICSFYENGKEFLKCKIEASIQGQSSTFYPKKNFTFDLLNDSNKKLQLKIDGLIASDSWHIKGFQRDTTLIRDNLTSSFWHTVRKSAPFPSNTLTTLPNDISSTASDLNYFEEDARFFADGFPVEIYVNSVFQGLYIFRLKKSRQNYKLDNNLKSNIMLEFDYTLTQPNKLLNWNVFEYGYYELKSPKITGYVPGGVINDTTVMNSIDNLWAWTSAIYNNTSTNENSVDLMAWIDYLIACEVADHWDGFNNNIILISHDGVRFMPYIYDTDHTFGLRNDGPLVSTKSSFILNQNAGNNNQNYTFWINFRTKYQSQIKARYTELRKSGIISVQTIDKIATDFIKPYSYENYKREFEKWGYGFTPDIGKGSLRQILQMANASINFLDSQWLNP